MPTFQKDGAFSFDLYQQLLKSNRMTPKDFEEGQKGELILKKARQAINELNADLKVIKLYIVRNNVWAGVEMFIDPIENFRAVFPRSMRLLANGALAHAFELDCTTMPNTGSHPAATLFTSALAVAQAPSRPKLSVHRTSPNPSPNKRTKPSLRTSN
jgi:hypothetical protein